MKTINRILLSFLGIMPMIASAAGESPYHAIVAADGSGNYRTVSEAIAAAPEGRTSPWRILVKSGDYDEFVVIPESKPFIHLIGQGKNSTAIRHKLNQGNRNMEAGRFANSTFWDYSCNNPEVDSPRKTSAVVWVNAPDFYTEGISYINDWGREAWSGPQALAFYGNADRHALKDCALISFQDTWRTPDRADTRTYARDCYVEGAVDYMYGGGDVMVENSTFYNVRSGSVIVAPNHHEEKWGYVIKDCVVDGNEEARDGRQKLGRPWQGNPRTVYINTTMLIPVAPQGWDDMGAIPAVFAEYNSRDRQGNPLDLSGRKTHFSTKSRKNTPALEGDAEKTRLTKEEADSYTYEAVIRPEEGWDPRAMMEPLPAVRNLTCTDGLLEWEPVEGAVGYVIFDGDDIIATVTGTSHRLDKVNRAIRIRPVNPAGSMGRTTLLR